MAEKSRIGFAILRSELQKLEQEPNKRVLTSDCGSLPVCGWTKAGWYTDPGNPGSHGSGRCGNDRNGWKRDVRIPMSHSALLSGTGEDMDGAEWRQLSIPELVTRR